VRVTRRPDPIGLPAFESWLDGADSKETRTLSPEDRVRAVLASASERAVRRNDRNALWLIAIGGAGALLAAAFHMGGSPKPAPEALSQPAPARRPELTSPRILASPSVMDLRPAATASSTVALEPVLPTLSPTAGVPAARRRVTVRNKGAVEEPQPGATSSPDAGFITKWDW
jgi:hypothetical protein